MGTRSLFDLSPVTSVLGCLRVYDTGEHENTIKIFICRFKEQLLIYSRKGIVLMRCRKL